MIEIATDVGPAAAKLELPDHDPKALLILGHGAGGGIDAADLRAVTAAARAAGYAVARTLQPYRVAGRKAPAPAPQLDSAFVAIVAALRTHVSPMPVVTGGRSSGARVACRTAAAVGAAAVLALAFPLHPPGRPDRTRAPELTSVTEPVLVVQGERDPFGGPGEFEQVGLPQHVRLHPVPGGNHSLAVPRGVPAVLTDVGRLVVSWLDATIAQ